MISREWRVRTSGSFPREPVRVEVQYNAELVAIRVVMNGPSHCRMTFQAADKAAVELARAAVCHGKAHGDATKLPTLAGYLSDHYGGCYPTNLFLALFNATDDTAE